MNKFTPELVALRKLHPGALAHADNVEVIAPRELSNRIHHLVTGRVLEPIFVPSPGRRTLVIPRPEGGVDYLTVAMANASLEAVQQPTGEHHA